MKPGRTIHAPPQTPAEQAKPSRREFLKAFGVGLAGAGLAAAASGCIIMPAVFETANAALDGSFQNWLANKGHRTLSNLSAPELGGHIDFIAKNSNLLGPMEQLDANSLSREWVALSDFIKPCHSFNCFSTKNQLRENVKLLLNTELGSGSGTLVTSEGHILTAAHVLTNLGSSSFSKITIVPGLDVAIAKLDTVDTSYSPQSLVRLAYTKPCSGAEVVIYGYPANAGASFQEVNGAVSLHDDAFGIILVKPIAQASAGVGVAPFISYGDGGADLRGDSGGPVALEDGRIVGVFSELAIKGEKGAETNVVLAMDTDCIREAVIRYMEEHLVGPIQELVMRINSRLG